MIAIQASGKGAWISQRSIDLAHSGESMANRGRLTGTDQVPEHKKTRRRYRLRV